MHHPRFARGYVNGLLLVGVQEGPAALRSSGSPVVMARSAGQHLLARASQTAGWGKLMQGPDTHSSPCLSGEQRKRVLKAVQWKAAVLVARHDLKQQKDPWSLPSCALGGLPEGLQMPGRHYTHHGCSHTTQPAGSWAPCLSGQLRAADCS